MLNLMSVLQHLAAKVRMDKVDPAYLHSPACRLVLREEARLKATNQEAADFAATLAKSTTVKVCIPHADWSSGRRPGSRQPIRRRLTSPPPSPSQPQWRYVARLPPLPRLPIGPQGGSAAQGDQSGGGWLRRRTRQVNHSEGTYPTLLAADWSSRRRPGSRRPIRRRLTSPPHSPSQPQWRYVSCSFLAAYWSSRRRRGSRPPIRRRHNTPLLAKPCTQ